ncbi:MAG: hypothetical protein L6Q92_02320 [Phycisphaerae bacterium]|nr:hypothetical protein [Phycisphaerae bacterium]
MSLGSGSISILERPRLGDASGLRRWLVPFALLLGGLVASGVTWTLSAAQPGMVYDPDRPIAVRCESCGSDFVLRYGDYKGAVDARQDLDRGIACGRCGAAKSVWRSWKDADAIANVRPSMPPPDEAAPVSTPEPQRPVAR